MVLNAEEPLTMRLLGLPLVGSVTARRVCLAGGFVQLWYPHTQSRYDKGRGSFMA